MNEFKFYSLLRADLLNIVTGVENSNGWFSWDNTTPNYVTKNRLDNIYRKYLEKATALGFFVVTRHLDCSNLAHEDYCTSNIYNKNISYQDDDYEWHGGQAFQGKRKCICPCSPDNDISEHYVIDDIIYEKGINAKAFENLEAIFIDIYNSIQSADSKKPRSAIREHLLLAILRINDELLPEPMDSFIASNS